LITEKKGTHMRKQKGFSLIELLIVVAIILIIAAIAIPNLLRARIAANESSAVSSIRTINTAEVTYQTAFPTTGYSTALASLGPAAATGCSGVAPVVANACLIDWVLGQASAAPGKSGYIFAETGQTPVGAISTDYTVGASPVTFNNTGVRNFCSNTDGVLRFNAGAAGSTPVTTLANCQPFTVLQ